MERWRCPACHRVRRKDYHRKVEIVDGAPQQQQPDVKPYVSDSDMTLYHGDCLDVLRTLSDESVDCCVTSPPYWGLRDYGAHGQIGLEETPADYVARMVEVFQQVKRVLSDDGVCWLNLGDSFMSGPYEPWGLKPKDQAGIPHRVYFALQADGWYGRMDNVWSKPNTMPESVSDRPTKSHEYIFLLAKQAIYYFDQDAVREPHESTRWGGPTITQPPTTKYAETTANGFAGAAEALSRPGREWNAYPEGGRNIRSVWQIPTAPYPGAHFACVDEQTECLTAEGWKRHDALRSGELAASFDLDTGTLTWEPIQDVAQYNVVDQEMVVGRSRDLEMVLTPNHRCVIQRRHPHTRIKQTPTIVRADALKSSHSIPTAAYWDYVGDASLPPEWAELLGWYIAEGHEARNTLAVELYQSETANPQHVLRISELLRQVGAEWTLARAERDWRGSRTVSVAFRVTGYAAARLRELAPRKRIPSSALLWSDDRIAALLRGLIDGDGHTRPDGRRIFVQKDEEQAGLVQALAMRLGLSATASKRPDGISTIYLTKHATRSFRGTNGRGSPPTRMTYTGVVWCPRLPHGTFIARRQGKPFITGNTFPEELAHRCIVAGCPGGGMVLDPFGGSGTTAFVARNLQRNSILIELNEDYCKLAAERLQQLSLLT